MTKFSRAPGGGTQKPSQPSADAFIGAAGQPGVSAPTAAVAEPFPWEGLDDKKRREPFNIRFTDAEKAMLKFVEENGRDSMHAFCISVLRPALRRQVEEITGQKLEDE
ncbi:hypothetical protein [Cupriavidus pinatubonensis]|uniref:Uncharacterized protein n=1 Tax=Cupriavidus pinatubonensis TaxID=248026 RepID=A0ABM8WRF4_9BURK|nr:hypothetical protein [Cupriavidus pinatubonensis]CAG9170035.1 hypothetical protein LMG23994_01787 [Cupriavidus pinatubonensis]